MTPGGVQSSGGTTDGNTLIAALAADATSVGTAFIAADSAKSIAKAGLKSPAATTFIYAGVAVVALLVVGLIVLKK